MGWQVGYDTNWGRWVGYGVPTLCDHPGCSEKIDRGLGYVCGGEPYGGEDGCGLFFCSDHGATGPCERCAAGAEPFTPTPDLDDWVDHMLTDSSWADWRTANPDAVAEMARASHSDHG